ncbi:MAG: integrase core domain-containing protein [Candidatus Berkiella sp.]
MSMTGKGRCTDNIYIERFWRSFKLDEFYLNENGSAKALRKAISLYIEFYNHKRWHQSLNYKTPAEVYSGGKEKIIPTWINASEKAVPLGVNTIIN